MKKVFFLFLVISNCSSLFSQIIDNRFSEIPSPSLAFHPDFIRQNKIKSIQASLASKPDNQSIIDKGLMELFKFDTTGKLTESCYTRLKNFEEKYIDVPAVYRRGRRIRAAYTKVERAYTYDTVFTFYYYNPAGKTIGTRSTDNFYYDTHYYDYDSLGRLTKEVRCRETNTGSSRTDFKLGVQQIMSSETFDYTQLSPSQMRMRSINDEGREYKKTLINYDARGNLMDRYEEFIVGWVRVRNTFKYDSLNRLIQQDYNSNAGGDLKESSTYEFDSGNKLLSEKKYKNEILLQNIEYLYDEQKKTLSSRIIRYFLESTIGITRYSYLFY